MKHLLYDNRDEQSKQDLYITLKELPAGQFAITIKKNRAIRSLSHNAYYWYCLTYVAAHANRGYTAEALHDISKERFNYEIIELPKSGTILRGKSTADLDSEEMSIYVSKFKVWAFDEFGITVPDRADVDYIQWMNTENRYNKTFNGF